MKGDEGPYMNDEGGVWVPRTVPYLEARRLASQEVEGRWQRLRYVGKEDVPLFGFVRDCHCDEVCELLYRWDDSIAEDVETGDRSCYVPSWAFQIEERP